MIAGYQRVIAQRHRIAAVVAVCLVVIAGFGAAFAGTAAAAAYTPPADADSDVPIVSTRGHFDVGWFPTIMRGASPVDGRDPYDTTGNIPGLETGACPAEIVVFVHGFNNNQNGAITNFNTVTQSLRANGYTGPVVGYSWDSKPSWTMLAWRSANKIATMNGPKLAQFIDDYLEACPATNVRVIAHSLGSRVVLEATQTLDDRYPGGPLIHSAHFVGSAVGNDAVTYHNGYGTAIENQIGQLHNKYSNDDRILRYAYTAGELSLSPLGRVGLRPELLAPVGYFEQDVTPIVGTDHSGYIGTVDGNGDLVNDGVVDLIVGDWRNESRLEEFPGERNPLVDTALAGLLRDYDERFPGIGKILFTNQDIRLHLQRDDLGGESYQIKTAIGGGLTDIRLLGRYVVGQESLWPAEAMVDGQLTQGVYRPAGTPTTEIFMNEETFLEVSNGCEMLQTYRAGVADGRIHQRLDTASTIRYEVLIKRAPAIAQMMDGPGDDVGRRC